MKNIAHAGISVWRAVAVALCLLWIQISYGQSSTINTQQFAESKSLAESLLAKRANLNALIWAPEELAQKYESRFTKLWDDLLHRESDRFAIVGAFPFITLVLCQHQTSEVRW